MEDSSTGMKPEGKPQQGTDTADHALTSSHSEQQNERDQQRNGKSSSETSTPRHARSRVHDGADPTVKGCTASRATLPPKKAFATTCSPASSAATSIATSFVNEAQMSRQLATAERPQVERATKLMPAPHLQVRGTRQDDRCLIGHTTSRTPATFYSASQQESAHNQPPPSVNREDRQAFVPHNKYWPKQPKKRHLGVVQGGYDREQHSAGRSESSSARSYGNQGAPYQLEEFQAARPGQSSVIANSNPLSIAASLRSQDAHYDFPVEREGGGVPASLNSLSTAASRSIGSDQDAVARAILFSSHRGSHATSSHVGYASRAYSQTRHEQERRLPPFFGAASAPALHEGVTPLHLQEEHEVAVAPQLSSNHGLSNILGQSINNAQMSYRSTIPSSPTSLVSAIQKQQARHAALSVSNRERLIGEVLQEKIRQNGLLSQSGVLGSRSSDNSGIPPSLHRSTLTEQRHAPSPFASVGTELSSASNYDQQIQDFLRLQDTLRSAQFSHLMRLSEGQAVERASLGSTVLQYPTSSTVDIKRTAHDIDRLLSRGGLPEAALHFDNQKDSRRRKRKHRSGYEAACSFSSRNSDIQREEPIVIPPCQEGTLPHHLHRSILPLSAIQDTSWLSEFLCFVRSELFEIFRASGEDVASRINSKSVSYQQIGIRCRFCAHLPHDDRASRSATFPSSLDRIYQSVIMIIREHFVKCNQIPEATMAKFVNLKKGQCKGITGSSKYWADAARRKGLVDTPNGIRFDETLIRSISK